MPTITKRIMKVEVILTSFQYSKSIESIPRYSVARWQPKGFSYPVLGFLAPFDVDTGKKMTAALPSDLYIRKYEKILEAAEGSLAEFFAQCEDETVMFCCWCSQSNRTSEKYLYCHTILIGRFIEEHYPDFRVQYLDGRHKDWFSDIYLGEL